MSIRLGPRIPVLPKVSTCPDRPLCIGMGVVFDSDDPVISALARQVCAQCPVLAWCDTERRHAEASRLPISGTWAGVSYAAVSEQ